MGAVTWPTAGLDCENYVVLIGTALPSREPGDHSEPWEACLRWLSQEQLVACGRPPRWHKLAPLRPGFAAVRAVASARVASCLDSICVACGMSGAVGSAGCPAPARRVVLQACAVHGTPAAVEGRQTAKAAASVLAVLRYTQETLGHGDHRAEAAAFAAKQRWASQVLESRTVCLPAAQPASQLDWLALAGAGCWLAGWLAG